MKTFLIHSTKHLTIAITYACLGVVIAALAFGIWFLNSRPALSVWHTTHLEHQFRLDSQVQDFREYLSLESKLFEELEQKVYHKTQNWVNQPLNRYVHGSYADPDNWLTPWNRSYEWPNAKAEFGVLLLHGMSDSPYSLSHFATHFKSSAHLLGLRSPGHGTIPSGLVDLSWQEMAKAVSLATEHLKEQLGDKPIYVVAFSTGAALALNHELEALKRGKGTSYQGMIFLSPAIGLSPVAAAAKWQDRLGQLLGLEKLSWNSILTEYDPFKYNSFAVNAGDVVYQLAEHNQLLMDGLAPETLAQLPNVLTFQSVADSTVSTPAVVRDLYQRLPLKDHQLVLFDLNRMAMNQALVVRDPLVSLLPMLQLDTPSFDMTIVQNRQASSKSKRIADVEANRYRPEKGVAHQPLGLSWPAGVYSLSHVALPYPATDNLYGIKFDKEIDRVQIGAAATRGERGILEISPSEVLRQKWNPFFPYVLQRVDSFIGDSTASN